jgi:hypothetical protein
METLAKYGMEFCAGRAVPVEPGWRAQINLRQDADLDRTEDFVGSLNWLAIETRLDILLATGELQRQSYVPSESDMKTAKGVLRYLESHSNFGITLAQNTARGLELFTDDVAHQDNPDGK